MMWVKGELLNHLEPGAVDPRRLLTRESGRGLFERLDWFNRVWNHTRAPGESVQVMRAWTERNHGWLFLVRTPRGDMRALANWYSMAVGPVFNVEAYPIHRLAMLKAMATRLARTRRAPWRVTLAPMPRAGGASDLLLRAFRSARWAAYRTQSSTSWTANVAGKSFDQYWAERPGQLRNTYARKSKKAEIETQILTRFDAEAWADYERIYAESWKPAEGAPDFLRETAMVEAEAGTLRLGIARHQGVAVAAQYWTVEHGIAYIHKLAHREAAKPLSAGTILSAALFRHVIDEDGVTLIDFGTGNDAYKADWMDESAPLDTVELYNLRTLRGLTGAARASLRRLVQHNSVN